MSVFTHDVLRASVLLTIVVSCMHPHFVIGFQSAMRDQGQMHGCSWVWAACPLRYDHMTWYQPLSLGSL